MPLYDLECQSCNHVWDDLLRRDEALPPCPECGGAEVTRLFPTGIMLHTNSGFGKGRKMLRDQFRSQEQFDIVMQGARRCGHRPGANDVYEPGLARFPGDPRAFVPSTDSRGYVQAVAEQADLSLDGPGNLKRKAKLLREPKRKRLSDRLLQEAAARTALVEPEIKRADKREVREEMERRFGSAK